MNFTAMQDRLEFVLNNNDDQSDSDFTAARKKQALNYAYEDEVNRAELEGSMRYFKSTTDITWPANAVTLSLVGLNPPIADRGMIAWKDITDTNPGYSLTFDDLGVAGDIFWRDRSTLQWGTSGPSAAKTIRIEYYAVAETLVEDDDVPALVPAQYIWLIIWSAAMFLKDIADERAPESWWRHYRERQLDFHKYLSRGRPTSDVPTVTRSPGAEAGFVY